MPATTSKRSHAGWYCSSQPAIGKKDQRFSRVSVIRKSPILRRHRCPPPWWCSAFGGRGRHSPPGPARRARSSPASAAGAPLGQGALQVQPVPPRQVHVEDDTGGHVGQRMLEELVRGRERFDPEPHRFQEPAQRPPHRGIILDHEHGCAPGGHGGAPPPPPGGGGGGGGGPGMRGNVN